MPAPLVIIHGWSDSSASFKNLAQLLSAKLNRPTQLIELADYVSMDDEVTFDDLTSALMRAWQRAQLPTAPQSVDVIVHSTGGLVIRDWLSRFYTPDTVPIKHLVTLAPANFGSPLAHKGEAFIGRVVKGLESPELFQVGEILLKGLELGSPYTWQLAQRDRFSNAIFYQPSKILCTVLIGDTDFTGISAASNEPGTDGVVRISCANLNCAYLEANFEKNPLQPTYNLKPANGMTAFGILTGENHHTIIAKDDGPKNPNTLDYIQRALEVSDDEFPAWCKTLESNNAATPGYQNTVSFVHDQFNSHVQDYFLEFYGEAENTNLLADLFHRNLITTTHACGDDNSYRSLYIDCALLYQELAKLGDALNVSLTVLPEFKQNGNVGYRTFTDDDIGSLAIKRNEIIDMFVANRTLLLEVLTRREQADKLFELNSF